MNLSKSSVKSIKGGKVSWEEAIIMLRKDPKHEKMIYDSYLTSDILDNCIRYYNSEEFKEILNIINKLIPTAKKVLDMPAGNGIASYAFKKIGFSVTAVEPDPALTVGRGALESTIKNNNIDDIKVIDAVGENLPFENQSFDIVFVRQGLHHAADLEKMLKEISRVLRKGGFLFAIREHVVDNYDKSLQEFLSSQVDHQLYGGENAFLLKDYKNAIVNSGLKIVCNYGPYDSIINLYPVTYKSLYSELLQSQFGRLLNSFLPDKLVYKIALWRLKKKKYSGRLYSFIAQK